MSLPWQLDRQHTEQTAKAATGGALRPAAWNQFITSLGFGPAMQVPA